MAGGQAEEMMGPRDIILQAVDPLPSRWLLGLEGRDHRLVREAIVVQLTGGRESKTCTVQLSTGAVRIVFAEVECKVTTVLISRLDLDAGGAPSGERPVSAASP